MKTLYTLCHCINLHVFPQNEFRHDDFRHDESRHDVFRHDDFRPDATVWTSKCRETHWNNAKLNHFLRTPVTLFFSLSACSLVRWKGLPF
jgi:hypothetical protein